MDTEEKIFGKKERSITRLSTGIAELDWLYGNKCNNNLYNAWWGLPSSKISLWAGVSGVGKSRIGKAVARNIYNRLKHISVNYVKYFSLEDDYDNPNSIYEITKIVRKNNNRVIFIDSINMLQEFGSGHDKNIKEIINEVRTICNDCETHVIFISQLNKEGDPRGSTTFPHLVDMVFEITDVKSHIKNNIKPDYLRSVLDYNIDNCVCFSIGEKNRCGPIGDKFRIIWKHNSDNVVIWSKNRMFDSNWTLANSNDEEYIEFLEIYTKAQEKIQNKILKEQGKQYWKNILISLLGGGKE